MSTVSRQFKEVPERSYVATSPFNLDVYTYTVSRSATTFQTTGTLAANVAGASTTTCPAGTVLRENGKKLFPGAHNGVTTLMVGVFWNTSKTDTTVSNMLSGFIDPNSPKFAVFSADRPNYMNVLPVDPTGGIADQGPPVITNGQIVNRVVSLTPTGTALTTYNAAGGTITLDTSLSNIFTLVLPTSSNAATVNVNASTLVAGITVRLLVSGASGGLFTFGTGFRKQTGTFPAVVNTAAVITFISDGTNLYEVSRTTALS